MEIRADIDPATHQWWGGAEDTMARIVEDGKVADFEALIWETFGSLPTETELNDLLRFDDDWLLGQLGIVEEEADGIQE